MFIHKIRDKIDDDDHPIFRFQAVHNYFSFAVLFELAIERRQAAETGSGCVTGNWDCYYRGVRTGDEVRSQNFGVNQAIYPDQG